VGLEERLSEREGEIGGLKDGERKVQEEWEEKLKLKERDVVRLEGSERELRRELRDRDTTIEELIKSRSEFRASLEKIEEEMRGLKEERRVFEECVRTLQERNRELGVLGEWDLDHDDDDGDGGSSFIYADAEEEDDGDDGDVFTATAPPMQQRPHSSMELRGDHRHAMFATGTQRPRTMAGAGSAEMDAWAKDVERVRVLRRETAVQVRGIRRVKEVIRRSLKYGDHNNNGHSHQQHGGVAGVDKRGKIP